MSVFSGIWRYFYKLFLNFQLMLRARLSSSEYICPYCGKEPPSPKLFYDKLGSIDMMTVYCCAEAQRAFRRYVQN